MANEMDKLKEAVGIFEQWRDSLPEAYQTMVAEKLYGMLDEVKAIKSGKEMAAFFKKLVAMTREINNALSLREDQDAR